MIALGWLAFRTRLGVRFSTFQDHPGSGRFRPMFSIVAIFVKRTTTDCQNAIAVAQES
jgi:hypothetical protein